MGETACKGEVFGEAAGFPEPAQPVGSATKERHDGALRRSAAAQRSATTDGYDGRRAPARQKGHLFYSHA